MFGLGLSFKNSGLELDCEIWQSAHLCLMVVVFFSHNSHKTTHDHQDDQPHLQF